MSEPASVLRILLMDDDPHIGALTAGMLRSLDHEVDFVKTGEEALEIFHRARAEGAPYAVAILDLTVIGGMGGKECFERMQAVDPEVIAIVSSGYDDQEFQRRYLDMGFAGFLTKPYRTTHLCQALDAALSRKR